MDDVAHVQTMSLIKFLPKSMWSFIAPIDILQNLSFDWLYVYPPFYIIHYTLYTLLNIEVQPHVQTMFLIKFLPKVILTFYCPLWYFQNEGSDLIFDLLFVIHTFVQSKLADIFNTFKCTCTRADNVSHQVLAKSHCDLLLSTLDIFKIKVPITSWNLKFSKWIFQLQPS